MVTNVPKAGVRIHGDELSWTFHAAVIELNKNLVLRLSGFQTAPTDRSPVVTRVTHACSSHHRW